MVEIRELSPELSDQIAAGEVIERPSSVVKELLENAIDAKSTRIQITFVEAGLKSITIEDNGIGIAPNQIDLAFRRHATSKIKTKDDLFKIQTLGFRGEALASISAVAKVEILTNTGEKAGTRAIFSDSQKQEQEVAAAKKGTKITVRDLFYNTPARLKYLKSEKTEITKIIDIVQRIALSYPELSIVLKNDRKVLLQTPGNGNLQQDLAEIYGRNIAMEMIKFEGSDADFTIEGYLSRPEVTRANRNFISILLNGRYIKNFLLSKAILQGYGVEIQPGRFPIVVLDIKMDPLLVDVNVHPTKQEVRLSKEPTLSRLITNTIYAALREEQSASSAVSNLANPTDQTEYDNLVLNLTKQKPEDILSSEEQRNLLEQVESQKPTESAETNNFVETTEVAETLDLIEIENQDPEHSLITSTWAKNVAIQSQLPAFPKSETKKDFDSVIGANEVAIDGGFPELIYRTQLNSGYLVADSDQGFYLVDQQAVQQRIYYDDLLKNLPKLSLDQQDLLTPIVFDFTQIEYMKLESHLEDFEKIGLHFQPFGQTSLVIHSHPTWLADGQEQVVIQKIIDLYLGTSNLSFADFRQKVVLLLSQNKLRVQAISLNQENGQHLLDQLGQTTNPYQSPKGQPTLVHFGLRDLDKMFKKIQRGDFTN